MQRALEQTFDWGEVFLDHRKLAPGGVWPEDLRQQAHASSVMLVLIGKRWLTLQGEDGVRRLDEPKDWVRQEIETGLTCGTLVIPVLIDGAPPLSKNAFRTIPQIAPLAELQAIPLDTKDWDAHLATIVSILEGRGFRRRGMSVAAAADAAKRPFRSTVPTRGHAPFAGRDSLLAEMEQLLADVTSTKLLVLYGQSGVGKSELAREYARRHRASYPGGTFVVDMQGSGPPVDLAKIRRTALGLPPSGLSLDEECQRALFDLADASTLLVYDNARQPGDLDPWLPPDGMPCHVVVTTTRDRWDERWDKLPVPPLADSASRDVVEQLAGADLARRFGGEVIQQAGGLPVQLVPLARSLRIESERGHATEVPDALADETQASFARAWAALGEDGQLVLWAASFFHRERIPPATLFNAFERAAGWPKARFDQALTSCADLLVLQGSDPLRMHQLWGRFVRTQPPVEESGRELGIKSTLFSRLLDAADELGAHPASVDAKLRLLSFDVDIGSWAEMRATGIDPKASRRIGRALTETGRFAEARPWFERAVAEAEHGDVHGRVDHASLGASLHLIGYCFSQTGEFAEARPWFERAVAEKERGDVHGRVDHASLEVIRTALASVLSALGGSGK